MDKTVFGLCVDEARAVFLGSPAEPYMDEGQGWSWHSICDATTKVCDRLQRRDVLAIVEELYDTDIPLCDESEELSAATNSRAQLKGFISLAIDTTLRANPDIAAEELRRMRASTAKYLDPAPA